MSTKLKYIPAKPQKYEQYLYNTKTTCSSLFPACQLPTLGIPDLIPAIIPPHLASIIYILKPRFVFHFLVTYLSKKKIIWYFIGILQLPTYKILVHFHSPLASEADNASNSIHYVARSHLETLNKTVAYFLS